MLPNAEHETRRVAKPRYLATRNAKRKLSGDQTRNKKPGTRNQEQKTRPSGDTRWRNSRQKATPGTFETLAGLVASGKLTAHIEKTFPNTHFREAIRYIEPMRTRGKVAVSWNDSFRS